MRLPTVQDDEEDAPSHTVQAIPPSSEIPDGINHCVLVHIGEHAGRTQIKGMHMKRVNMCLMIPRLSRGSSSSHLQDQLGKQ